jgi:PAS domain S-box-containing protein
MHLVFITATVLTGFLTLTMALYYASQKTFPGFGYWTIGGGLITLGYLMIVLRGVLPTSPAIVIQNFLFPLAAVFYLSGTRSFLGFSDMSRWWYSLPLANALFAAYTVCWFDSAAWRTVTVSLTFSAPHLLTAASIFKDYPRTKSLFSLIICGEMVLASTVLLVWAIWSLTVSDFHVLMASTAHASYFVSLMVLQIIIPFSFLILNAERFSRELLTAQDALKFSAEKYSKAFHATPDSITITRITDGKVVEVNEAFSLMTGYSKSEAQASSTVALNVWENPQDRVRVVASLRDQKSVRDYEAKFRTKSGQILDCLYSGETILLGDEVHVLSVVRDITERKRAEKELIKEKEFTEVVLNAQRDTIFVFAPSTGKAIRWNSTFSNISGYTDAEIETLRTPEAYYSQEDLEKASSFIENVLREGKGRIELSFICKDGRRIPTEYEVSTLSDSLTKKTYLISVGRDITDRKRAEEEREHYRGQLVQSQKMEALGTLAAGIAHDFNNMLQVILGYSDLLLLGKKKGEPGYSELQKIIKTSEDARDLVQRIRVYSRRADIQPIALDLNKSIREIEKQLRQTLPISINIETHLTKNLSTINADPRLMNQMVMNLSANAAEAMPEGGMLIIETQNVMLDKDFCRRHPILEPELHVLLTISDTGRGIAPEHLDRLFDPFYSTKMRDYHKGTGLGLPFVQGIVELHKGFIDLSSEVGRGTTVRIYIPAMQTAQAQKAVEELSVPPGGTETILLVEDEAMVRNLCRDTLMQFGYNVLAVCDGQEALEVYEREKEHLSLVILDIIMPRMDGKECFKELLRINPKIKVLISSGVIKEELIQEVVNLGAKGSLMKPFVVGDLLQKVREVIDTD